MNTVSPVLSESAECETRSLCLWESGVARRESWASRKAGTADGFVFKAFVYYKLYILEGLVHLNHRKTYSGVLRYISASRAKQFDESICFQFCLLIVTLKNYEGVVYIALTKHKHRYCFKKKKMKMLRISQGPFKTFQLHKCQLKSKLSQYSMGERNGIDNITG